METLRFAASKIEQGDLTLYATAIPVEILAQDGFCSVDTLDPRDDTGYQRMLNKARARKLANYIVQGQNDRDAFLPTSIFLATEKNFRFNSSTNTISFSIDHVGPFNVVDGQHRLEGLRMAVDQDERVRDFIVPVNIAVGLPFLHQMCHFLIVNTTQKSVEKSIEQRIVARLTQSVDVEDVPNLPKWIQNLVDTGDVDKAVQLADYMNNELKSPFYDKIRMPNVIAATGAINQNTFVNPVIKYVLSASNPILHKEFEKQCKIFLNYWIAITSIIFGYGENLHGDEEYSADIERTSLFRYQGLELFCQFCVSFFIHLSHDGDYRVETMKVLLKRCFDNIDTEFLEVSHSEFWKRGSTASGLNAAGVRQYAHALNKSLGQISTNSEDKI